MSESKKVVIVTGASSGIGAATAELLAAKGYRVFGTSRKGAKSGGKFEMLQLDVTSDDSVKACVTEVMKKAGRIDFLVNNAGSGISGAAEESSLEQAHQLFETNVFGVIRMAKAVLPIMRERRAGRIVSISSVLGMLPAPFSALYASTKHAVEGYCESLDHEVRTFGVRSLLVQPGVTKTAFGDNMQEADTPIPAYQAGRDLFKHAMEKMLPKGDAPELIAETILKAMTEARPSLRYAPGQAKPMTMLRRFVPATIFDRQFRKQMHLPKA